ncbi:MAG: long-chain-fatty-acid--CoA ligase, partial [Mycobacteriaceae bacterium]|nr:long-chain-fatty-acid--CoA ligase [Mycobacteriaceae bacterium]
MTAAGSRTVANLLDAHVRDSPGRPALYCGDRAMTFAELDAAADRIAAALAAAGVRPGDRVAHLGAESVDFYAALVGCARAGAVFVPISNRLAGDEIAYILADSGAALLLADAELAPDRAGAPSAVRMLDGDLTGWYGAFPAVRPPHRAAADDAVVQLYTSGTTGRPKGVVLAHRSFFAVEAALREAGLDWLDWRTSDVGLVGLPGFHIGGMWCAVQALLAGATTVTMPRFDAADAVALVSARGVTVACMVPAMVQWVLAEPAADSAALASIRRIVYGGAPMPEAVLTQAESVIGCEFAQIYGLTETGNTAMCLSPADHRRGGTLLRSAGRPYPGFAAKVVGPDGAALPTGQIGEVCLHTPARMLGYFANADATDAAVVDGWIRTGDAGSLDADGYLYLSDRIKDLILVGGEHVYPAEVERTLREHPAVADAAVVGAPDPQFGELAHAVVVARPGAAVTSTELLAFAGRRLAAHKVPATFEFSAALPRNASGKILRRRLREGVARRPDRSREPAALTATQLAYWIGRRPDLALGGVAPWCYVEIDRAAGKLVTGDPAAEIAALQTAWNRLIADHDMLRLTVADDGSAHVPPSRPEYRIGVTDLRGLPDHEVAEALSGLTADKSHQVLDPAVWPLFDIAAALLPSGGLRIFLGFDMIATDVPSWALLMRQWRDLTERPDAYAAQPPSTDIQNDPQVALNARHGSFWTAAHPLSRIDRDRRYWQARIPTLPPGPALAWAHPLDRLHSEQFRRREVALSAEQWSALRAECGSRGLHPRAVLVAAYGLVLNRWGASDPFCVNTVVFDRADHIPQSAVGDFSIASLTQLPPPSAWRSFADLAHAVHDRMAIDLAHSAYGGVEVQQAMGAAAPRYPVVFTDCTGLAAADPVAWLGAEVHAVSQTPQVVLDCMVWDRADGGLRFIWDAVDRALPDGFVPGMAAAYERLLTALTDAASWQREELGANPFFEPVSVLEPQARPDTGPLLADPQRLRSRIDPDAVAVTGASRLLTHGELADRSTAMAAALLRGGVAPGDRVAVVAGRSTAQIAACYAVLAAGAAFVPLDPGWPATRIAAACRRAEVRHALTAGGPPASLSPSITAIDVDQLFETAATEPVPAAARPTDLAYVIFTSGSTGEPKGVAIDHAGARTTIDDINDRFGIGPADRVLALSAPTFDLSVYDVFGLVGAGGAIVLPEAAQASDPAEWIDLIAEHRVTVWNTAPAVAQMLVEYAEHDPAALDRLASLRLMLLSGDWIPLTLPQRLHAMLPGLRVVSLGGATEASIWSICYPVDHVDPGWHSIPYGRALRDQFFLVLDEAGAPCPVGAAGELHIGGAGLARGYAGDDAQTAQRFAAHPRFGERLYRTGDLGRWRPDGTIEFLGRTDRQLKVLGHRIEPGEIEAVLNALPQIRQCLVVGHRGKDQSPRLVAYLVGPATPADLKSVTARAHEQLPAYMTPARWVVLDELPLTSNGKIDHAALPDPFAAEPTSRPLTSAEQWVAALWGELLDAEITTPDADFFALGGHSVLATRMVHRVRTEGHPQIGLRDVAANTTVAAFAGLLAQRRPTGRRVAAEPRPAPARAVSGQPFPLTRVQHAYLHGRGDGSPACYVFHEFHCTDLDLDRYEQAWNLV